MSFYLRASIGKVLSCLEINNYTVADKRSSHNILSFVVDGKCVCTRSRALENNCEISRATHGKMLQELYQVKNK